MHLSVARWFCIVFTSISLLALSTAQAWAEKKIGVLFFFEQPRYDASFKGIKDQLEKEGLSEPAVSYTVYRARGSYIEAAKLVRKLAEAKTDLIVTLGTTATLLATKEIKDVPVVFSTVFDPVETGIAKGMRSSGNNTTGSITRIPLSKIVDALKEFAPVKRLAVLYSPGEKNSAAQLAELQSVQKKSNVKVIPVPVTKAEEMTAILREVVQTTDAIYLTGSGIIGAMTPQIVSTAHRSKIPTATHLDDMIDKGVLMGICADPYLIGRLAGEKAAKILRGANPSAIPIETVKKTALVFNMKSARAGQFRIPAAFAKKIGKSIE